MQHQTKNCKLEHGDQSLGMIAPEDRLEMRPDKKMLEITTEDCEALITKLSRKQVASRVSREQMTPRVHRTYQSRSL